MCFCLFVVVVVYLFVGRLVFPILLCILLSSTRVSAGNRKTTGSARTPATWPSPHSAAPSFTVYTAPALQFIPREPSEFLFYQFYRLFCASFRGFTIPVLWFILCQFQGFYYTSFTVYSVTVFFFFFSFLFLSVPVLGVLLYEFYDLFCASFMGFTIRVL